MPAVVPPTNNLHGNGHALLPAAAKVGDLAPVLKLRDLHGKTVALKDLGGKALVLFWNPACGFCQQMLHDLKEWEADPPPGASDSF